MPKPNGTVILDEVAVVAKARDGFTTQPENCKIIDGIKIYPLRYGIFDDKLVKSYLQTLKTQGAVLQKLNSIKHGVKINNSTNNYSYHPMPLQQGYLYVSSEVDKGIYEFKVLKQGQFKLIDFLSKDDIQEPSIAIGESNDFIIAKTNDKLSFYSTPIRLTKAIAIKKLWDEKDELIKDNTIDVGKWAKEGRSGEVRLIDGIIDPQASWIMYPNIGDTLDPSELAANFNRLTNAKTKNKEVKTKNRDVFFVINDIWGIIDQVRADLLNTHLYHESVMRSIRTGVSPDVIFKNMIGLAGDEEIYTDQQLTGKTKAELEQPSAIHLMAVSLYRFLYNSETEQWKSYVSKAEGQTDKAYLEKILAVEDRRKCRYEIDCKRNAFTKVLESEIFKSFLSYYNCISVEDHNDDEASRYYEMIVEAKRMIADIINVYVAAPNEKDKHIDIDSESRWYSLFGHHDTYVHRINNILLQKEHPAVQLLNTHVILDKYIDNLSDTVAFNITDDSDPYDEESNAYKIIAKDAEDPKITAYIRMADSIMNTFRKAAFDKFTIKAIVKMIETPETKGFIVCAREEIKKVVNKSAYFKSRYNIDKHYDWYGKKKNGNVKVYGNNSKELKKGIVRMDVQKANPSKVDRISRAICTNKLWRVMVDGIFIISLPSVINDFDKKHPIRATLSGVKYIAGVAALLEKYEVVSFVPKPGFAYKFAGTAAKRAVAFGAIGGACLAFSDMWDAVEMSKRGDSNAALALTLSAQAGLGEATIALLFAEAAWAGPAGIALGLIIIGGHLWVEFFAETDLQLFIGLTVFSNENMYKAKTPYELISIISREHIRSKVSEDKPYLKDYRLQLQEFTYIHSGLYDLKITSNFESICYEGGTDELRQYDPYLHASFGCELVVQINKYLYDIEDVNIQSYICFDTSLDWFRDKSCDAFPLDEWPINVRPTSAMPFNKLYNPVRDYYDKAVLYETGKPGPIRSISEWISQKTRTSHNNEKTPFEVLNDENFIPFAFRDAFSFRNGMGETVFYLILTLDYTRMNNKEIEYIPYSIPNTEGKTYIIHKYKVTIPKESYTKDNNTYWVHDMRRQKVTKEKVVINTLENFYKDEF
jgi:hypothetical protein